jgi:murein L,D-transpeptidase YcbB/YkuD
VSVRSRAGKALILALFSVSLAACDGGSPLGGEQATVSRSDVNDSRARAFYEARQWRAAWDEENAETLTEVIGGAMAHGLKPSLFLKEDGLPEDEAAREIALTEAALRYADALARGYSDPAKLGRTYTIPRAKADVAAGLANALEAGDLAAWFASLPPQTDEYRALSQAHQQLVLSAAKADAAPVAAGRLIKPGQRDARLPAIAASLSAMGYLPSPGEAASQRYGAPLVAAVKAFQVDNGTEPDGVIGGETLAALNAGPAARARQLAVAMERLRWLEREPPATRIDVNIAAAILDYYRGARLVDQRRVVVGEPGWETPQLQSNLFQLVANPLWRPPESIIEDELSKKSGGWLARNGFEWRDGRLVQRSGEKNSLGLVKFDLDNKKAIYLHDTPAKALFATDERHRSHGCIRVHNALQFAAMIASENGVLTEFEEALIDGDEEYVSLKTKIPVRLLYHTVFWDGSRVQFRQDVYGWDDDVAAAIGLVRSAARKPHRHRPGDIGP